ncbi:F-box domain-containing protein [Caenorhabditis elegans]|uniref:F-box domain-containing protein n=1 Tax=Caenorhabditis elegans TaxID=6239 RepID=Q9XU99_CAEEL|nr:F-box domain-containing protein [Caenorhabditis elegans]CAB05491.2 F-box domain-containing protein [Caenorhabditis elegans]|eukprot:NP_507041.2 F-box A protein [Caenorhabditis elegans]
MKNVTRVGKIITRFKKINLKRPISTSVVPKPESSCEAKFEDDFCNSSLRLADLPVDVIFHILDKLPLIDKNIIRHVNRNLRRIIDWQQLMYKEVTFNIGPMASQLYFPGKEYESNMYEQRKNNCVILIRHGNKTSKRMIQNKDQRELALSDLFSVMSRQGLEFLNISFSHHETIQERENTYQRIKHYFSLMKCPGVKSLSLGGFKLQEIPCILSALKAGTLETIRLAYPRNLRDVFDVVRTEQWKLAKEVIIDGRCDFNSIIDHLANFSFITMEFSFLTFENVLKLMNVLNDSANFKFGTFYGTLVNKDSFMEIFELGSNLKIDFTNDEYFNIQRKIIETINICWY